MKYINFKSIIYLTKFIFPSLDLKSIATKFIRDKLNNTSIEF